MRCAGVSAASIVRRYFLGQMGDDGFAVADGLAVIDDIGQLPARRGGSVENMLMDERHPRELEEGKYLQPVAIIVGDAEQFWVGIQCQHRLCTPKRNLAPACRAIAA